MRSIIFFLFIFIAACSSGEQEPTSSTAEKENAEPLEQGILATNFNTPWSIAASGDDFYITERAGKLFLVSDAGEITEQTLELSAPLYTRGEAGLLGFSLLDADQGYIYYSYNAGDGPRNRVSKITKTDDTWTESEVIIDEIPGARIHNGGRLEQGPEGHLFITTGDAADPECAQDKESLAGKILRMNIDGSVPEDNPFEESYVYSYGHRNPQGITWTEDGTMYSTEHGESAKDEINIIEPGKNYGWPVIEGDEQAEGMVTPFYHTGNDTWAPSGIDAFEGKLYVAALRGERLLEVEPESLEINVLSEEYGRIRDILFTEGYGHGITSNRDGRGNPEEEDDVFFRFTP
ncbi:PQQ-dependent sugar dehydrogenase [Salimicrobium halophilum]|uniref:Glucose/arabinose dehydrogenase, beta-propeller fold n=1 Tax=Salimicrobium halophilum TaxID=86666 RepID=A0A1G8RK69_9BACI|nr:PQQ-dependent sugar dehydrogenase [Salimicrobium halophilum]SDJ17356.1 Glucose/arabinose dehydrogenase, beta-propeller fold [Salimicrobium halophilum]